MIGIIHGLIFRLSTKVLAQFQCYISRHGYSMLRSISKFDDEVLVVFFRCASMTVDAAIVQIIWKWYSEMDAGDWILNDYYIIRTSVDMCVYIDFELSLSGILSANANFVWWLLIVWFPAHSIAGGNFMRKKQGNCTWHAEWYQVVDQIWDPIFMRRTDIKLSTMLSEHI